MGRGALISITFGGELPPRLDKEIAGCDRLGGPSRPGRWIAGKWSTGRWITGRWITGRWI